MKEDLIDIKNLSHTLSDMGRVVIGVSGGADSMVLLHQILRNREKFSNDFKVLHVDHGLQQESASWAKVVSEYCGQHGMPCEIARVDARLHDNNIEQAARKARYQAFAAQDCDAIMLAHHADDQVETFFLKLFRGSGVKGLRCMSTVSDCWFDPSKRVLRPLLEVHREVIDRYAEDHGVPYVTDPTNRDVSYDRNWIRRVLMPTIRSRNEIADANIRRTISIQNETYGLLNELAELDLSSCRMDDGSLDWRVVRTMSLPRLKNMIMHICNSRNLIDVSTHHVEQFAKGLLSADPESRNELRLRDFKLQKIGKRIVVI